MTSEKEDKTNESDYEHEGEESEEDDKQLSANESDVNQLKDGNECEGDEETGPKQSDEIHNLVDLVRYK